MTLNCRGKLISLERPKVMGILNITPNSFYDGGAYQTEKALLKQTEKMLAEGADFIDVGGYSTKPGAEEVSTKDELKRVVPIVEKLCREFPGILISVDTFRSEVAAQTIDAGASLINDISAGRFDDQMMKTVAEHQVPYIMMHMKGTPQTMIHNNQYTDLLKDIIFYFSKKIEAARAAGINDLIIDPGFGFAKNIDQNFELLRKMALLENLDCPVLAGLSRKSTIYKSLNIKPEESLNGTTTLNTLALLNGANILRVHDVQEAVECVELCRRYKA